MPFGAGGSSAPGSSEVPEMAEPSKTEQRKAEHVNIILQENVSAEYNYWNDVRLVHTALPEIDLDDVDFREGGVKDRKSTRLNSSHGYISYAVFCLKKKKKLNQLLTHKKECWSVTT